MRTNNVMPSGRRDYIIGALFLFEDLRALTDETWFLRDLAFSNEKYTNKPGVSPPMRQPCI